MSNWDGGAVWVRAMNFKVQNISQLHFFQAHMESNFVGLNQNKFPLTFSLYDTNFKWISKLVIWQ